MTPDARKYIDDVLRGRRPAAKWERLAVERHVRDLATAEARGLRYDPGAGQRVVSFFRFLKHSKGEWAGRSFALAGGQQFLLCCLFGWRRKDGTRRFRTAYVEVPRKNGKSTLAAGVGLYLLVADGEQGAEVYTAATKRDQARIVHGEAVRMVKSSPALNGRVGIFKDNLHVLATNSKFEPLGADADTMDGLNLHAAIVDELHAHKTRALWDVLDTATGARRQPLLFAITTAGYDRHSVCYELHSHTKKVLEGVAQDDSHFGIIYTIDEGDDWADESTWVKANPNWGESVKPDDLRRKADRAKSMPAAQNAFRRLHLNEWTEQADRWIDLALWDAGDDPIDPVLLAGLPCYSGLDLASTSDLAAFVSLFPDIPHDGHYTTLPLFWVPKETARARAERDRAPYPQWIDEGYLRATDGNAVDYDVIRRDVNEFNEQHQVKEIAADRWNAQQIITQLGGDGFEVVAFGQGFASMSGPTKELEKLLLAKQLHHGGHPVLRWCAANVAVEQDAAGNLKPSKKKSSEKIDGIVGLIMALGRASVRQPADEWYTPGVLTK